MARIFDKIKPFSLLLLALLGMKCGSVMAANAFPLGVDPAETQFAPVAHAGNAMMSFKALNQFQSAWQNNLLSARSANMCYSPNDDCCDSSINTSALSSCSQCCDLCDLCDLCDSPNPPTSNSITGPAVSWNGEGIWFDTFASNAYQQNRKQIRRFNANMYGIMLGAQRPLSENWQVGLAGGYAHTDILGKGLRANSSHINTSQVTAYLGYTSGGWFLDNFFTHAWNHYNDSRNIQLPGLNRNALASYNGSTYGILMSGGYNCFMECGWTVTPLAAIQYDNLRMNSFKETGAESFNLAQQSQQYRMIQSSLGVMLGYPIPFCGGILFTEIHSKWLYDIKQYRFNSKSNFIDGGPTFTTVGIGSERNQANAGAGVTLFAINNWALKATYDFYYTYNYLDHVGRATVAYKF
jgi:outer membrane autotransporter protein